MIIMSAVTLPLSEGCQCRLHMLVLLHGQALSSSPGPTRPAGDLREADQPDSTGSGCGGSSGGGTGRTAAAYEEALRRTMQVYLTAWMLSPEVDERRVEADLAAVNADMRGF